MIEPKDSSEKIQIMQEGGKKLSNIFAKLIKLLKPGINLLSIEAESLKLIKESGGSPAFMMVPGYKWSTCLNVNDEIVHGIPKNYLIKAGDVVNLDIGLYYKGYNTDMCGSIKIKDERSKIKDEKEIDRFLETGKLALKEAEKQARAGNRVGHISQRIQEIVEKAGYSCSYNLTGHTIGKSLHETPNIPCILTREIAKTPLLKIGDTIAIEVIYSQGKPHLVTDEDGWTIKTKDGKIAAVFEETVAISNKGLKVLTPLPF